MKYSKLKVYLLCLLGLGLHPLSQVLAQSNNPEVAFHGMLVIGSDMPTQSGIEHDIYIHHLPMFVIPHRFQGLWKVTFGEQADRRFNDHRRRAVNSDTIYTLVPQHTFALRELIESRDSFRADLFHGHFERGGQVLIPNVTVRLLQNVHWHELKQTDTQPESARYIVFGQGPEAFLAHEITVSPNYDQIVKISAMPPQRFSEGATVVLPKRDDWVGLHEGERAIGLIHTEGNDSTNQPAVRIKVLSEYYLEERELSFNELPNME